jgi:hypothetical protein
MAQGEAFYRTLLGEFTTMTNEVAAQFREQGRLMREQATLNVGATMDQEEEEGVEDPTIEAAADLHGSLFLLVRSHH